MVQMRGVSRRFPGGHYGVRGVTLEVERGETLAKRIGQEHSLALRERTRDP